MFSTSLKYCPMCCKVRRDTKKKVNGETISTNVSLSQCFSTMNLACIIWVLSILSPHNSSLFTVFYAFQAHAHSKVKYMWICIVHLHANTSNALRYGSHSVTCKQHDSCLYSQSQSITAIWLVLIAPTHGGMARLNWPGWLVRLR